MEALVLAQLVLAPLVLVVQGPAVAAVLVVVAQVVLVGDSRQKVCISQHQVLPQPRFTYGMVQ